MQSNIENRHQDGVCEVITRVGLTKVNVHAMNQFRTRWRHCLGKEGRESFENGFLPNYNSYLVWFSSSFSTKQEICSTLKVHFIVIFTPIEQRFVIQMALINLGQRLFMNYGKADVIFVVDHQELPGHRLILGETCPYFDRLLCGDFEESKSKKVQITGTSAKVFKEVIRFIYLGELEIDGWKIDDLLALLSSAHEYQLEQLMDVVTKAFDNQPLDLDSWELVKSAASLYDSDKLKAMCVSLVGAKVHDFISGKDLEKFSAEFIYSMLDSSEVANCNQDHLLFAICAWEKHHNSAGLSSMLSKIDWTSVSPAISNLVLKDVFSNVKNVEGFTFKNQLAEMMGKSTEIFARVESLRLLDRAKVGFALEKYQCSIVFYYEGCYDDSYISIEFMKENGCKVEIPVKSIKFESSTSLFQGVYAYNLRCEYFDMVVSESTSNRWFKYSAAFSDTEAVSEIGFQLQNVPNLSEVRLRNIVLS